MLTQGDGPSSSRTNLRGVIVRGLPRRSHLAVSRVAIVRSVWSCQREWGASVASDRGVSARAAGETGAKPDLKQLWQTALGELQVGLSRANYDTWFKDTAIISEEDDVFLVGVPN